jgi:hypothetical protein
MKKNNWEMAGVIGVDAGLCWIGDPCYIMGKDANEHPVKTWREFCEKLHKHEETKNDGVMQWNYKLGHEGLGVSIGCFGGDGTYPVYVRRDADGLILEAKVVFNEG